MSEITTNVTKHAKLKWLNESI